MNNKTHAQNTVADIEKIMAKLKRRLNAVNRDYCELVPSLCTYVSLQIALTHAKKWVQIEEREENK